MSSEEKPIWDCRGGLESFIETMKQLNFRVEYIGKPRSIGVIHDSGYKGVEYLAPNSRKSLINLAESCEGDGIIILNIKGREENHKAGNEDSDYTFIPYRLISKDQVSEKE